MVAASLAALDLLEGSDELREQLRRNAAFFREAMTAAGFDLVGRDHPIIPVMTYDASLAACMAERLLEEGVYVIAFSYPVVPKGQARIRTRMSALHTRVQLEAAVDAFRRVGTELGVIS